ncbi:MAG: hypothetical protein WAQ27_02425 [Candidatus Microsaccharimonas sp.]
MSDFEQRGIVAGGCEVSFDDFGGTSGGCGTTTQFPEAFEQLPPAPVLPEVVAVELKPGPYDQFETAEQLRAEVRRTLTALGKRAIDLDDALTVAFIMEDASRDLRNFDEDSHGSGLRMTHRGNNPFKHHFNQQQAQQ